MGVAVEPSKSLESPREPSDPLLDVTGLTVRYGRSVVAVRDVSLTVGEGECVGIVGPNGAGKTSVVRAISGFLPVEPGKVVGGTIKLGGKSVAGRQPSSMAKLGVHIVPERDKVFPNLTIHDHLTLAKRGTFDPSTLPERLHPLFERQSVRAGALSGGERQLLGLMCAVAAQPRLLIVDEFSLGLSPAAIRVVMETVRWMIQSLNLSALVIEQNVEVARELCERIYVMRNGSSIWSGPSADLSDDITESGYFG